ncbi:phytoene desaturase-like, partial [Contarinia nasturtii]|uniref:phytoene desaturase-like n=1 Tax=Contarinia nasturtii TaxID=265458 RepID=UPI0012D4AAB5
MSPYKAPAMFNLLQYTEIAEGIFYVRGGFHKVIEALENIATKKFNAIFHYNKIIKKIIVDEQNVAKGVEFEDGSKKYADIVVCNADLVYAYNHLLPPTKYGKELGEKAALTSSSISFYWGLSRKVPELDVHNIFLANDYKSSFDSIFQQQVLSNDPFFYVNVPSRIDESAAPKGKDTVVLLLPISHISSNNKDCMDEWVKRARKRVIEILEERLGLNNFESLIETEIINDPRSWESKFKLWKGSILGLSHNISQVLHLRPKTRSQLFKNLYFVGASAHPGTGVPIVLCGAKLAQQQILKDYKHINRGHEDIISQNILFGFILIASCVLLLILV